MRTLLFVNELEDGRTIYHEWPTVVCEHCGRTDDAWRPTCARCLKPHNHIKELANLRIFYFMCNKLVAETPVDIDEILRLDGFRSYLAYGSYLLGTGNEYCKFL